MFIQISDVAWSIEALQAAADQGLRLPSELVMEIADDLLPLGKEEEMDVAIAAHLIADNFPCIEDLDYIEGFEWQYGTITDPQAWFDLSSRMVEGNDNRVTQTEVDAFLVFPENFEKELDIEEVRA